MLKLRIYSHLTGFAKKEAKEPVNMKRLSHIPNITVICLVCKKIEDSSKFLYIYNVRTVFLLKMNYNICK